MESKRKKKQIGFIELLNSFSEADFLNFEKFINSPYFNTNNSIVLLFIFIKKEHKTGRLSTLTFEEMFKNVFTNENFEGSKIRKLAVKMSSLIKQYFIYSNIKNYPQTNEIFLIKELNKRNLGSFLLEELKLYNCTRTNANMGDLFFKMNDVMIAYDEYRFYNATLNYEGLNKTLVNIDKTIDYIYLNGKILLMIINSLNRKFSKDIKDTFDAKNFMELNRKRFIELKEEMPTFYLLYLLAEIIMNDNHNKIKELLVFFDNNLEDIPYGTADLVFNILINYLIIENETNQLTNKLHFTYSDLEAWGIADRLKIVSPFVYIFITNLISQLPSSNLVESYLSSLSQKTYCELKENSIHLSNAIICIKAKKYSDATKYLLQIKTKDSNIYLISKILMLQVNIKLKNKIFIRTEVDSLKHYLSRKSDIPENLVIRTNQFLKTMKLS